MKRQNNIFATTIAAGLLLFLAGCAKYNAIPLQRIEGKSAKSAKKKVSLAYHVFNKADCKKYLDRDVLKKGYQPLQITIVNNTDATYTISSESLSLPTASADVVAQKVHTSTAGRAAGYGAAAVLTFGLFAIPAIVDGIGSAESNKQLDTDFSSKAFRLDGVLKPHSVLNGVVFVARESFSEDFTFTLKNAKTEQPLVLRSLSGLQKQK